MTVCAKAGKDRRDTSSANPWPSHTFSSQPTSRPLSALSGILGRALACVHAALVASSLRSAHPRISPNQRAPLPRLRARCACSTRYVCSVYFHHSAPLPKTRARGPEPIDGQRRRVWRTTGCSESTACCPTATRAANGLHLPCGAHTRDTQNGH